MSRTGYVRTWIVFPSTVWGIVDNTFVEQGLQKSYSFQVPRRIKMALKLGKAIYVGEGKNVWPHIHIDEGAEAVVL